MCLGIFSCIKYAYFIYSFKSCIVLVRKRKREAKKGNEKSGIDIVEINYNRDLIFVVNFYRTEFLDFLLKNFK